METLDEFDRNFTRKVLYYKSLALTHKAELTVPKRQVVGDHLKIFRLVKKTCARNIPPPEFRILFRFAFTDPMRR